jgi:hypothetical protein
VPPSRSAAASLHAQRRIQAGRDSLASEGRAPIDRFDARPGRPQAGSMEQPGSLPVVRVERSTGTYPHPSLTPTNPRNPEGGPHVPLPSL